MRVVQYCQARPSLETWHTKIVRRDTGSLPRSCIPPCTVYSPPVVEVRPIKHANSISTRNTARGLLMHFPRDEVATPYASARLSFSCKSLSGVWADYGEASVVLCQLFCRDGFIDIRFKLHADAIS